MFWKPPNWPKTSPNFVHPPKPIFTRTIKFKTAQSGNTGNSVFCRSNGGGSGSGSLNARHSPMRRTCVWDHFILNPDNVNCKHCYDVLKIKKRAPWNHLKRHIQRSPWQDMKQHTKYNDPVHRRALFLLSNDRNHIHSFYHPATSLLFGLKTLFIRVRKLAFWVAFAHPVMPVTIYATAIDAFCSS